MKSSIRFYANWLIDQAKAHGLTDQERLSIIADAPRVDVSDAEPEDPRVKFYLNACSTQNDAICQILAPALRFPLFSEDQEMFPGTTEKDGYFVGEHVAETLAMDAARRIQELEGQVKVLNERLGGGQQSADKASKWGIGS